MEDTQGGSQQSSRSRQDLPPRNLVATLANGQASTDPISARRVSLRAFRCRSHGQHEYTADAATGNTGAKPKLILGTQETDFPINPWSPDNIGGPKPPENIARKGTPHATNAVQGLVTSGDCWKKNKLAGHAATTRVKQQQPTTIDWPAIQQDLSPVTSFNHLSHIPTGHICITKPLINAPNLNNQCYKSRFGNFLAKRLRPHNKVRGRQPQFTCPRPVAGSRWLRHQSGRGHRRGDPRVPWPDADGIGQDGEWQLVPVLSNWGPRVRRDAVGRRDVRKKLVGFGQNFAWPAIGFSAKSKLHRRKC